MSMSKEAKSLSAKDWLFVNMVVITLGRILRDHHFTALQVPSEIKAKSQLMTPDATWKASQDTKEEHL